MLNNGKNGHSWWKHVLTGILAIAFGLCAIAISAGIMVGRTLVPAVAVLRIVWLGCFANRSSPIAISNKPLAQIQA